MENASKALILAGGVLIGVLLLTLMVSLYTTMGNFSGTVNDNIENNKLNEFNSQFEIYNKKEDLTAQDVITLGNIAKNYNHTQEEPALQIRVILTKMDDNKYRNVQTLNSDTTYEFMKTYSVKNQNTKFKCTSIKYNENTKIVSIINLEKI